ncbi:hypothetical protein CALVIDRAFT_602662 [Calocera viscosa TUFC12733]|uniref:DUF6533 domain-containing protein n=1 Tax=Calocera viscosa (strain TUFC12733) TaxID=1330018 RepID=A0A167GPF2_CALVF|nr:hypothetical protein CALVIDRAFT_602662 [Calocera viscosa TUFC12733]
MSTLTPALLQDAWDVQAFGFSSMAACAWLFYDTVIAMDQEIEHIWRAKISAVKVLYIFARHANLGIMIFLATTGAAHSLPDAVCHAWPSVSGAGMIVAGVSVDLLQMLRVRAIFHAQKKVTIPLYVFFSGVLLVAIIIICTKPPASEIQPKSIFVVGCSNNGGGTPTLVAWIAEMALGGIFLILTVVKLYPQLRSRFGHTHLASTILQGGVAFYAVIFVTELANMIYLQLMAKSPRQNLLNITLPWTLAVYGIAGPRLVLHLRGVMTQSMDVEESDNLNIPGQIDMPTMPSRSTSFRRLSSSEVAA